MRRTLALSRSALSLSRSVLVALLCVVAMLPVPAFAHQTAATITPVVDGFRPAVEGVRAVVQATQDSTLLTLEPEHGVTVEVLDDDGRAWARVTAEGLEVDRTNPALYRGRSADGVVPDPLPAVGEPWALVADERRVQWFEHRLHPADLVVPPAVLAGDRVVDVLAWSVPLRVDGREVALTGRLEHVPVLGRVVPRLVGGREVAPGVTVDVVAGGVPGLFLAVEGASVVVTGRDGEPYARIDEDGVAVNTRSTTFADQQLGRAVLDADGVATGEGPSFASVSATPSHSWLERRAALDGIVPPEEVRRSDTEVVVDRWSVPLEVDGEPLVVEGETVWVPLAVTEAALDDRARGGPRWELGVAAVVGFGLLVAGLRRRDRSP